MLLLLTLLAAQDPTVPEVEGKLTVLCTSINNKIPNQISMDKALDAEEKKLTEQKKKGIKGLDEKIALVWKKMKDERTKEMATIKATMDEVRTELNILSGNNPSKLQRIGALLEKSDKSNEAAQVVTARDALQKAALDAKQKMDLWFKDLTEADYKTQYNVGGKGYSQAVYEAQYKKAAAGYRAELQDVQNALKKLRNEVVEVMAYHQKVIDEKEDAVTALENKLVDKVNEYEDHLIKHAKVEKPKWEKTMKDYAKAVLDLGGLLKKGKNLNTDDAKGLLADIKRRHSVLADFVKDEKVREFHDKSEAIDKLFPQLETHGEMRAWHVGTKKWWGKVLGQD